MRATRVAPMGASRPAGPNDFTGQSRRTPRCKCRLECVPLPGQLCVGFAVGAPGGLEAIEGSLFLKLHVARPSSPRVRLLPPQCHGWQHLWKESVSSCSIRCLELFHLLSCVHPPLSKTHLQHRRILPAVNCGAWLCEMCSAHCTSLGTGPREPLPALSWQRRPSSGHSPAFMPESSRPPSPLSSDGRRP